MVRRMREPEDESDGLTVGLVHWALPPTIGGVETHLADYMQVLHERGIRVVAFTGEKAAWRELRRFGKVEYHELLHLTGSGAHAKDGPECVDTLVKWFGKKARKHRIDVIHGHNLHNFSTAPARALNIVCPQQGIARHHTYHNYWDEMKRSAANVTCWEGQWATSDFVARLCTGYGGNLPDTSYLGIRPERFASRRKPLEGRSTKADEPEGTPLILQPARLLLWKGPLYALEMLGQLHDEGCRARLVLTDNSRLIDWDDERHALRAELTAKIEKMGLSDWVSFRSASCWEMPKLYEEADIVINPSHGEPLGLVALEAMAAGRPVVVTDSGGMAETVVHSTGALIPDDDRIAEHLYFAVRSFLEDPERAVEAGEKGRRHVAEHFHTDTYAGQMIDAYRKSREAMRQKEEPPTDQQRWRRPALRKGKTFVPRWAPLPTSTYAAVPDLESVEPREPAPAEAASR